MFSFLAYRSGSKIVRLAFFIIMSILFSYLIFTQKYLLFIHPRYLWLLYFSIPIFLICALLEIFLLKMPSRERVNLATLLYALPLLLFLLQLSNFSSSLSINDFIFGTKNSSHKIYIEERALQPENQNEGQDGKAQGIGSGFDQNLIEGSDKEEEIFFPKYDNTIKVYSSYYSSFLHELYSLNKAYEGKSFTFLAKAEKSPYASEGLYLFGRPIMLCCAADSRNLGVFARLDNNMRVELNKWYYVTGKIEYVSGYLQNEPKKIGPVLTVDKLDIAKKPATPYAFYLPEKKLLP